MSIEQLPPEIWAAIVVQVTTPNRLFACSRYLHAIAGRVQLPVELCALAPTLRQVLNWLSRHASSAWLANASNLVSQQYNGAELCADGGALALLATKEEAKNYRDMAMFHEHRESLQLETLQIKTVYLEAIGEIDNRLHLTKTSLPLYCEIVALRGSAHPQLTLLHTEIARQGAEIVEVDQLRTADMLDLLLLLDAPSTTVPCNLVALRLRMELWSKV